MKNRNIAYGCFLAIGIMLIGISVYILGVSLETFTPIDPIGGGIVLYLLIGPLLFLSWLTGGIFSMIFRDDKKLLIMTFLPVLLLVLMIIFGYLFEEKAALLLYMCAMLTTVLYIVWSLNWFFIARKRVPTPD